MLQIVTFPPIFKIPNYPSNLPQRLIFSPNLLRLLFFIFNKNIARISKIDRTVENMGKIRICR